MSLCLATPAAWSGPASFPVCFAGARLLAHGSQAILREEVRRQEVRRQAARRQEVRRQEVRRQEVRGEGTYRQAVCGEEVPRQEDGEESEEAVLGDGDARGVSARDVAVDGAVGLERVGVSPLGLLVRIRVRA